MRKQIKGSNIEEIMNFSKDALNEEYYIECLMLSASIIEERISSVLKKMNLKIENSVKRNFESLIKRGKKSKDPYTKNLANEIDNLNLLPIIYKRNDIVHNLVNNSKLINYSNIKPVAVDMHNKMKLLCNSIMRWKKQWKK